DGIRDRNVTGVQTCALPICRPVPGADMTTSSETPASSPDPAFAGRTYPPGPVHVVSAAKIAEFARATAATSPLHTDTEAARAAGHADVVAPPTFLVSLAQATEAQYIEDPAAGIDFTRVVHGEETFTLHRAVVAGDRLVPTLTVESVRSAGGHALCIRTSVSQDSAPWSKASPRKSIA